VMLARNNLVSIEHHPVMLPEVLAGLNLKPEGIYVDATFGRGGHSQAILAALGEKGRLLVLDKDPAAIQVARQLNEQDRRVTVKQGSFTLLECFCAEQGVSQTVDGILMDLGVSSPQLDTAERGFSFQLEGPIDMRMDPTTGQSAGEWLNTAKEADIAYVLKTYGEERFSGRIARAIVAAREITPLQNTKELAGIIAKANPAWEKFKHPATRSFQAIRIWVNQELEDLSIGLKQALKVLAIGGRLVVLSFHSLEDRIVKRFIQKEEKGDEYPRDLPVMEVDFHRTLKRVGSQQKPSPMETSINARARSATLRVAEKIGKII
jgi:16S rRNA (cytosine1402-N4)-methyltransferase